jgi:hypothetical protein
MEGKMATNVGNANGLMNGQLRSAIASVGRFLLQFVLMFVAMMIGMGAYIAIFGKRPSGPNLVFWDAGMQLSMIPGMVALMLYQKHGWRHSAEMIVAMLIGPAIFLSAAQLGLYNYISGLSLNTLVGFADSAMFLGMLADMLYRRDMYTSPHAGHQHAGHAEHAGHAH